MQLALGSGMRPLPSIDLLAGAERVTRHPSVQKGLGSTRSSPRVPIQRGGGLAHSVETPQLLGQHTWQWGQAAALPAALPGMPGHTPA